MARGLNSDDTAKQQTSQDYAAPPRVERFGQHKGVSRYFIQATALNIRFARHSRTPLSFARMPFELYRVLFNARATNSSNLESKSFRMGDWFDFL